jgi:hypothetical protein
VKLKPHFEMAFGIALFGVNAAFALLLYLELASGVWYYQLMYGTLAVTFDAAMLLLWMRGLRSRNVAFVVIAVAFACISLVASSASALTIIERKIHVVTNDTQFVDSLREALEATDEDIAANRRAIDKTPPDFSTRLRELNALAGQLRARRDVQSAQLREASRESATSRSTATSMFTLAAKALHVSDEDVMLPFLLGTSLMLIVGSFALTAPRREVRASATAVFGTTLHVVRDGRALCGATPLPQSPGRVVACVVCMSKNAKENLHG